jgi:small subunit ribosomal protein S16
MALVIRMRQQGANSRQQFRVVVTDVRAPRDGKYLEKLGWYNPFAAEGKNFQLDIPRIQFWIDQGAQISDRVKSMVKNFAPDVIQALTAKEVVKREKARVKRRFKAKAKANIQASAQAKSKE